MRHTHAFVLVGLALGLLVACGGDSSGPSGAGGPIGGQGVRVGNTFFRSNHNGSIDPAVDTVAVGTPLDWSWVGTGGVSHSVRSSGTPAFASSAIMSGSGTTYSVTFSSPGVFTYDCAVHGSAMTGRVVVQ